MNRLNEILSNTEKNLNYAGWIPGISMASGSLRMIMGKVELLAGSLIGLADLAQFKLDSPGWTYAAHGIANICRGLLETVLLIGNLAWFFYDQSERRFCYPSEETAVHPSPAPSVQRNDAAPFQASQKDLFRNVPPLVSEEDSSEDKKNCDSGYTRECAL